MPTSEHKPTQPTALSRLTHSKAALVTLVTAVILALAGTTYGYAAMQKSVTLSLDGQSQDVSALGDTVGDVLDAEGVEVGEHDLVAPSLDEEVTDGSQISVRFGRELRLSVDGDTQKYWVTSTDVAGALTEIGKRFLDADLSASRGGSVDRGGMTLKVVTPKTLDVKLGAGKVDKREVTAATVKGALKELDVKVDKHDTVRPGLGKELEDGDSVVFTDIRVVEKRIRTEPIEAGTVEREDDSIYEGETEVVRSGEDGVRDVTYRVTYRNGQLVTRQVLEQEVLRDPVATIVAVGTKAEVVEAPAANFVSGSTVWDQLAQCESGGNWAINSGNGYYGGLQFNVGTWQSYGGPGYPHQQSRETQIMIAERVLAATGGYGSWPACSASLGLPQ